MTRGLSGLGMSGFGDLCTAGWISYPDGLTPFGNPTIPPSFFGSLDRSRPFRPDALGARPRRPLIDFGAGHSLSYSWPSLAREFFNHPENVLR